MELAVKSLNELEKCLMEAKEERQQELTEATGTELVATLANAALPQDLVQHVGSGIVVGTGAVGTVMIASAGGSVALAAAPLTTAVVSAVLINVVINDEEACWEAGYRLGKKWNSMWDTVCFWRK